MRAFTAWVNFRLRETEEQVHHPILESSSYSTVLILFYSPHPILQSSSYSTALILFYSPHPILQLSSYSTVLILFYSRYHPQLCDFLRLSHLSSYMKKNSCVCPLVSLSVRMSGLSVRLSVLMSVRPSVHWSVGPFVRWSISPLVGWSVHQSLTHFRPHNLHRRHTY